MQQHSCATCGSDRLKAPRQVDGAWFALCTDCLFETEMEEVAASAGADAAFRVKGAAEMTPQQMADLKRPRAPA